MRNKYGLHLIEIDQPEVQENKINKLKELGLIYDKPLKKIKPLNIIKSWANRHIPLIKKLNSMNYDTNNLKDKVKK